MLLMKKTFFLSFFHILFLFIFQDYILLLFAFWLPNLNTFYFSSII